MPKQLIGPNTPNLPDDQGVTGPNLPYAPLVPDFESARTFKSSKSLELETKIGIDRRVNSGQTDMRKPEMGFFEEIFKTSKMTTEITRNEQGPWAEDHSADEWHENMEVINKIILDEDNENKPSDEVISYLMDENKYEQLAYLLRTNYGYSEVKLKEEADAERAVRLTGKRQEHEEFMGETSWVGKTTEFVVGGGVQIATNPYYWAGLATGGVAYVNGSRILASLVLGSTEAAGEVVTAFDTYDYKREIGMHYDGGVAATEVVIAFGFGAVGPVPFLEFAKRAKGKLKTARKLGKLPESVDNQVSDMVAVLESVAENPNVKDVKEALVKLDKVEKAIEMDKGPVRLDSIDEDKLADDLVDEAVDVEAAPGTKKEVPEPEENTEIIAALDEKIKDEKKTKIQEEAETELAHLEKCIGTDGKIVQPSRTPSKRSQKRASRKAVRKAKKTQSIVEAQPQVLPTETNLKPSDFKAAKDAFQGGL